MKTEVITIDEGSFKLAKRMYIPLRKLTRNNHYNLYVKEETKKGIKYTKYSKMKFLEFNHIVSKWISSNAPGTAYSKTLNVSDYGLNWYVSKK